MIDRRTLIRHQTLISILQADDKYLLYSVTFPLTPVKAIAGLSQQKLGLCECQY